MAGAAKGVFDVSYIAIVPYVDLTLLNPETSSFVAYCKARLYKD